MAFIEKDSYKTRNNKELNDIYQKIVKNRDEIKEKDIKAETIAKCDVDHNDKIEKEEANEFFNKVIAPAKFPYITIIDHKTNEPTRYYFTQSSRSDIKIEASGPIATLKDGSGIVIFEKEMVADVEDQTIAMAEAGQTITAVELEYRRLTERIVNEHILIDAKANRKLVKQKDVLDKDGKMVKVDITDIEAQENYIRNKVEEPSEDEIINYMKMKGIDSATPEQGEYIKKDIMRMNGEIELAKYKKAFIDKLKNDKGEFKNITLKDKAIAYCFEIQSQLNEIGDLINQQAEYNYQLNVLNLSRPSDKEGRDKLINWNNELEKQITDAKAKAIAIYNKITNDWELSPSKKAQLMIICSKGCKFAGGNWTENCLKEAVKISDNDPYAVMSLADHYFGRSATANYDNVTCSMNEDETDRSIEVMEDALKSYEDKIEERKGEIDDLKKKSYLLVSLLAAKYSSLTKKIITMGENIILDGGAIFNGPKEGICKANIKIMKNYADDIKDLVIDHSEEAFGVKYTRQDMDDLVNTGECKKIGWNRGFSATASGLKFMQDGTDIYGRKISYLSLEDKKAYMEDLSKKMDEGLPLDGENKTVEDCIYVNMAILQRSYDECAGKINALTAMLTNATDKFVIGKLESDLKIFSKQIEQLKAIIDFRHYMNMPVNTVDGYNLYEQNSSVDSLLESINGFKAKPPFDEEGKIKISEPGRQFEWLKTKLNKQYNELEAAENMGRNEMEKAQAGKDKKLVDAKLYTLDKFTKNYSKKKAEEKGNILVECVAFLNKEKTEVKERVMDTAKEYIDNREEVYEDDNKVLTAYNTDMNTKLEELSKGNEKSYIDRYNAELETAKENKDYARLDQLLDAEVVSVNMQIKAVETAVEVAAENKEGAKVMRYGDLLLERFDKLLAEPEKYQFKYEDIKVYRKKARSAYETAMELMTTGADLKSLGYRFLQIGEFNLAKNAFMKAKEKDSKIVVDNELKITQDQTAIPAGAKIQIHHNTVLSKAEIYGAIMSKTDDQGNIAEKDVKAAVENIYRRKANRASAMVTRDASGNLLVYVTEKRASVYLVDADQLNMDPKWIRPYFSKVEGKIYNEVNVIEALNNLFKNNPGNFKATSSYTIKEDENGVTVKVELKQTELTAGATVGGSYDTKTRWGGMGTYYDQNAFGTGKYGGLNINCIYRWKNGKNVPWTGGIGLELPVSNTTSVIAEYAYDHSWENYESRSYKGGFRQQWNEYITTKHLFNYRVAEDTDERTGISRTTHNIVAENSVMWDWTVRAANNPVTPVSGVALSIFADLGYQIEGGKGFGQMSADATWYMFSLLKDYMVFSVNGSFGGTYNAMDKASKFRSQYTDLSTEAGDYYGLGEADLGLTIPGISKVLPLQLYGYVRTEAIGDYDDKAIFRLGAGPGAKIRVPLVNIPLDIKYDALHNIWIFGMTRRF